MKTNKGKSALHIAAEAGRLKVVQYFVRKKNFFDVNDKTTWGSFLGLMILCFIFKISMSWESPFKLLPMF